MTRFPLFPKSVNTLRCDARASGCSAIRLNALIGDSHATQPVEAIPVTTTVRVALIKASLLAASAAALL